MGFLKRSIDVANQSIQFEIAENANSVNLKFNPEFLPHLGNMKVRIEKVTKNATDRILYSGTMGDLSKILKFGFPVLGAMLPFSIGKSLILNDDNKLVINLEFSGDDAIAGTVPTSFEYEINKFIETTNNPLVIKKIQVDEELSFSTEFYPFLLIPPTVQSYETVVMVENASSLNVEPRKIFLGRELIGSTMQKDHDFLNMVTSPNQEITIKGNVNVYLILV